MRVRIKRLNERAQIPQKAHDSDFCYDCYATSEEEIAPNVWKYGLGIAVQPVRPIQTKMDYDVCIDARPRSSVWKTGMVLSNCIGTIDEGYTGEISAVFYHVLPDMPRYRIGDKVCQIHLTCGQAIEWMEDELNDTDRGANGYGSTDKNEQK